MGSATHTTDMQHYQTQIPYLWAFQDIKTIILVLKEIVISAMADFMQKPTVMKVGDTFKLKTKLSKKNAGSVKYISEMV